MVLNKVGFSGVIIIMEIKIHCTSLYEVLDSIITEYTCKRSNKGKEIIGCYWIDVSNGVTSRTITRKVLNNKLRYYLNKYKYHDEMTTEYMDEIKQGIKKLNDFIQKCVDAEDRYYILFEDDKK